ncbi:NAD-dependent epimerase/dehydratase family protein [Gorillibacterium sp. CAU 1737]|uniref:NAD-dependent epimerase/dehydratase family protein n=1 Tax=Gorillibacterium sp. CAU 1737 TaxID=3140362 RepID=UPI0032601FC4
MVKSCLITGGAGFIGCEVSKLLEDEFDEILVLDNFHPQVHPNQERPLFLSKKATIIIGDVCKEEDWNAFFGRYHPNVILHLAAETGTGQSLTESYRHTNVNVSGLAQMLDGIVRHNRFPEKIVLASSRAVYGEGCWKRKDGTTFYPSVRSRAQLDGGKWEFEDSVYLPSVSEYTIPHPVNVYGVTKHTQEMLLETWCRAFSVKYGIVRLQNVYGPGQSLKNSYTGIVALFGRIAKSGGSIPLFEDGLMLRDFVYISDVADAIHKVIKSPHVHNAIYDVSSGQSTTIQNIATIISNLYQAPKPHVNGSYRLGDVRHAACTGDAIKVELAWEPRIGLNEGLTRLCGWIDNQLG